MNQERIQRLLRPLRCVLYMIGNLYLYSRRQSEPLTMLDSTEITFIAGNSPWQHLFSRVQSKLPQVLDPLTFETHSLPL